MGIAPVELQKETTGSVQGAVERKKAYSCADTSADQGKYKKEQQIKSRLVQLYGQQGNAQRGNIGTSENDAVRRFDAPAAPGHKAAYARKTVKQRNGGYQQSRGIVEGNRILFTVPADRGYGADEPSVEDEGAEEHRQDPIPTVRDGSPVPDNQRYINQHPQTSAAHEDTDDDDAKQVPEVVVVQVSGSAALIGVPDV